jgi:hypothetical protein
LTHDRLASVVEEKWALYAVQITRLGPQVPQQRLRRKILARHTLDEFSCGIAPAVAVDIVAEPGEEGGELALRELCVEVAGVLSRLLEELGGVEVAERVGGEVADRAVGPVDVLEAAAGVVGRGEAEVLAHLFVPRAGDVVWGEVAGEHGLLELEPEEDVEVVGGLVGVDADERGADVVDREDELVE